MTRILRMEMKGFKSFATRTEVVFGDNFNCILGPNGSGKSNVLDALCFVLGKAGAKGLRVEKSGNLIYNGGKTKKPAKEGSVSIWFDNKDRIFSSIDSDEVKITRIIKTNGQGVYKINDETSTRTKIVDLLSMAHINPDGYNIILQGDIVRLIEMSPNERRQIIEEIAGIDVYEDKKTKAMRELERVEGKLNDADIVLSERESYLKELKADRDKAQKYKDLEEKRKRNRKTLLVQDIKKKEAENESTEKKIDANKEQIERIEGRIKEIRGQIAADKKEIDAINKEVEEKGETDQVRIHKDVEQLKVDLAVNKQRLQTVEGELEKLQARTVELEESKKELDEKTQDLQKRKEELEKRIELREENKKQVEEKIAEFKKKHNLDEETSTDERIDEIDKQLEQTQNEMNQLREDQQNTLREKDKVEMQLQTIDDKLEKLASVQEEHKKELEKLKEKKTQFKNATKDLSKALSDSSEYASQLSNARNKLVSKQEELAKLQAQQSSILEHLGGGSALKAVLEKRKSEQRIHGTVAELGSVPEGFESALEIAAGNKIKSVVTEDDKVAADCIKYLKDNKLGVATFLPMNKIRAPAIKDELKNLKKPGVKGLAVDLMKFDKKYQKVFEYVFGNTLIVDSVETARKIGVGSTRMVTMSGDIVEASGAMQGGFRQRKTKGGLFGQEQVAKRIEKLNSEIGDTQGVVNTLEQKAKDNEELISRLRNLKGELEGEIVKIEKSLHLDSDDASLDQNKKKELQEQDKRLDEKIDEIQDEISEKNRDFAKLKMERQQLRDKLSELRNPAKLAELKSFDEKKMELQQEIIQLQGDLKNTKTEIETIIGREGEKIEEILKQHQKEKEGFEKEKQELEAKLEAQQKELAEKEKQQAEFHEQFKELFTRRSKLNDQVNKAENEIATQNTKQREIEQKNNAHSLEQARVKAELSGLYEEDKDYQGVEPYEDKTREKIQRELREFEKMKEDLGAVNMRALEIYDEVEKEYKQLQQKKETLRKERSDVLVMINEIDSKKKDLFMKTFEALEDNFKRIFSSLLVKGQAGLVLENKEDPFAGGVEIKVRLSGKKFLDIRSLSGGEKTMTALAFLFAVQEYQPASFYILDEVDAALDKKNSQKLAELIRSYVKHAQYVVISHNDGVISEADNLYGVSMNEHGMSKVTTLKL
ncbi:MAG: chromosome segregation protein SMC [Candidatus Woesearchaeota archaeon]